MAEWKQFATSTWRSLADTLDGLDIAFCLFDREDRALCWNRTFLAFFPEHAGHVRLGEPYSSNLRRFYESRLGADELGSIDEYIASGIARHQQQWRPFEFEHRARRLLVSSLPAEGLGRVRIWKEMAANDFVPYAQPWNSAASSFDAYVLDQIADGAMVIGSDRAVKWVNQAFARMYGLGLSEWAQGRPFAAIFEEAWRISGHVDWAAQHAASAAGLEERLRFAGAPFELELPHQRWVRVISKPAPDGLGFSTHVDVTELKRQQRALAEAELRARRSQSVLEATIHTLQQGLMMVNSDGIIEVCNRRAKELLGLPPELALPGTLFNDVLEFQWATNEFARTPADIQAFVRSGGILTTPHVYDRERPDGTIIEIQSVPIEGGGIVRTYIDVTARRLQEHRLRRRSMFDALTSVATREHFLEELTKIAYDSGRTGVRFAILFIDLDGFKSINDRHGHAVGDELLAEVAARLRGATRETDVVARLGGDEFVIIQRQVHGEPEAALLAHRILVQLAELRAVSGHSIEVGASIGVAYFPDAGREPETLLRQADKAMYAAKALGKNCVVVCDAFDPG